jgi:polysaccharide export outer membrane protein
MMKAGMLLVLLLQLFSSCVNPRKAIYFNDLKDSALFSDVEPPEHVIRRNDLLSITVNSQNPDASRMFNLSNETKVRASTPSGDVVEPAGYLVDKEGVIQFLLLGNIRAEGLTKKQLQETIRQQLIRQKLLVDPIVDVRLLNFKVTVLGEVGRPTVLTVPNEKITLLEALGLAGDITIYAKKNNVLLIREEQGQRKTTRLNLNAADFFNSPYYHLRANDIVYVEPNRARVASASRLNQLLPTIISGLSIAIIVFDRLIQ